MLDLSKSSIHRLAVLFLIMLLLQACQHVQPTRVPVNSYQIIDLNSVDRYEFRGKMSFSNGKDGGSGSVQWQNENGFISARLKGPLGSRSWTISELSHGAELVSNEGTVYAASAKELISNELGWEVPWTQLKSWILGQAHNKVESQIRWQENGYTVIEDGWHINYSRLKSYSNDSSTKLPHKMIARNGDYSIKLTLKSWIW